MADSNILELESQLEEGVPFELFRFTHGDLTYMYTSKGEDVSIPITENGLTRTEKYYSDHIKRGSLEPSSSGGETSASITVSKDNPVAKLYQGAPPEVPVLLKILRLHATDKTKYDVDFYGKIAQAAFTESECELTVKLENWLAKEIPNGNYQYFCNNTIFDENCRLKKADWQVNVFLDKVIGLDVYCDTFANYEDGYFEGGLLYFDGNVRMIAKHVGKICTLRYPFLQSPRNDVVVLPGCNHKFRTCALKFNNWLNFTACPYVQPTDSEKNPTGKGVYWIDSDVVQRDTDGFVGTIKI